MSTVFIGVDAGGTGTRAIAATASGQVVGRGRAAGANAWSSGTAPAAAIASAVASALASNDASAVAGGVIAVAGGASSVPQHAEAVVRAWHALGIDVEPRIILDVVAAHAAGTDAPGGLVLAAGTGSIAALVEDGQLVDRAGGRGWLVGDEGSAVWLGIEGVRAVLWALDGRGPETALRALVTDALDVSDASDLATAITDAVYGGTPAALGGLAPLVVAAAEDGDAVARSIVHRAAGHLLETAFAAAGERTPASIVLAGSLLTRVPSIGDLVRAGLVERWPSVDISGSVSGEAGAVALAIRWGTGTPVSMMVLEMLRG